MNNWYLYCKKADFASISDRFHISPMLARILVNRGVSSDSEIREYLSGGTGDLHDPFLLKDMMKGASAALSAVKEGRKIRIIGDYDVDGICSAYILKSFITLIGGNADVRLPNRMLDGYGMNESMALDARGDGVSMIITCDNGVSSYDAVSLAVSFGIDCIITDHHEVPAQVPPALAIIDAKQPGETYPFRELCGAGVAYKFIQAMSVLAGNDGDMNISSDSMNALLDDMLQFAGMATITDIVSLKGENRILAKEGIKRLRKTSNPGLRALCAVRGIDPAEIKGYHIGFVIGPCINSAGRLKNAGIAFDLFDTKDPAEAEKIAGELNSLNEERKALTMDQTLAAEKILEADGLPDRCRVIVVYLPEAHESVAGIIAGKLKDKYNRPALVVTESEDGLKGSARSTDDFNMIEALSRIPQCFRKFGGHAKAAGFTLAVSPDELSALLNNDPGASKIMPDKKIWIDMQLPFRYATKEFTEELRMLEPYGVDNDRPSFAEKNVRINSMRVLGRLGNVLKLDLSNAEGDCIEGVIFSHGQDISLLEQKIAGTAERLGERALFSIRYFPSVNEFRGICTVQAVIDELKFPDE